MWKAMTLMSLVIACLTLPAQAAAPERTVSGSSVISTHDPKIRVDLPASAQYVGADRWLLLGFDDCEMHLFVDADANRHIQRLYWVQFEAYIPSRPELHHDYSGSRRIRINGLEFYLDTWVQNADEPTEKGSDSEHQRQLLAAKGYRRPTNGMYVRLVHLPDAQMRKELMVIYGEDLAPTGFTASQLGKGGAAHDRWPSIEKALIQRAKERVSFVP
ncbi:hypothetical protein [Dyella telluris]|uniref:Uncharacterized protein n=1 Tax=Dyella telluris TaxID=2763498 RepID=A0A7G8PZ20_9GAMM|nr:hypothetical protein [Dyella telluris]QNJ99777.1 hypothetical protein H8F01_11505 [Dyella telluris]